METTIMGYIGVIYYVALYRVFFTIMIYIYDTYIYSLPEYGCMSYGLKLGWGVL